MSSPGGLAYWRTRAEEWAVSNARRYFDWSHDRGRQGGDTREQPATGPQDRRRPSKSSRLFVGRPLMSLKRLGSHARKPENQIRQSRRLSGSSLERRCWKRREGEKTAWRDDNSLNVGVWGIVRGRL